MLFFSKALKADNDRPTPGGGGNRIASTPPLTTNIYDTILFMCVGTIVPPAGLKTEPTVNRRTLLVQNIFRSDVPLRFPLRLPIECIFPPTAGAHTRH